MKKVLLVLPALALVLLAACATSSLETRTFKIAGGESVSLPFEYGVARSTENADIKIEVTGFVLDSLKRELTYAFGFTEKQAEALRSVKVEDVTGPEAEVVVLDSAPHLSAKGYWKGNSTSHKKEDPAVAWVYDSGDTVKVFRFTVMTAAGRQIVMYQGSVWSARTKPYAEAILEPLR